MSRSLGAIDVNNAHTYGVIAAQGQHSMATMAKAMVFDRLSPWATLLELSSTHPLTGKRIATLARLAEGFGQPFPDFAHHQAEAEKEINRRRLWDIFMRDLVIIVLPGLVGFMCFAFTLHLFLSLGVWAVFAGLMRLIYHYPRIREDTPSLTSQELITNPYVSPIVGMPVRMEGQLIGRADAGNALSPDVMMHDKFGMLPLLYNSVYGFFGDIWAGLFKTKANINAHATAVGWYRRSLSGYVELLELKTENNTLRANPYISTLLWFGLPALGCFVMFAINPSQSMPAWDLNDWFRAIRMFL